MLRYIRRGKPWAVVLGAHNEKASYPWGQFRSLELTIYPVRDGRIGTRRRKQLGRFWLYTLVSPGMCEVHAGLDKRARIR